MTAGVCDREDLMRQLAQVPEPCSIAMGAPTNICDMGLVEQVTLRDGTARVVLCLTDPACINYRRIAQYVTDALMQLDGVDRVEVTQTTEVRWTPDRVTIRGQAQGAGGVAADSSATSRVMLDQRMQRER
jgi:metal-sulfur cluster biosynthetic enzyme